MKTIIFISLFIQFVTNHEHFNVPKAGVFFSDELNKQPSAVGTIFAMDFQIASELRESGLMGVYLITNLINGGQYVGLSKNIRRRIWEHKSHASDRVTTISRAIYKYGTHNFKIELLERVDDSDLLFLREQYWIKVLKPRYNRNKGGRGNPRPVSEKTKEILRQHAKKQWESRTPEEKMLIIKNNLTGPRPDYKMPEYLKEILRKRMIGHRPSKETNRKRSESMKRIMIGNKNGNKPIIKLLDGIPVETFSSTKVAADSLGIHPSCITGVLKNRRKTAGGFKWKYLNS